MTDSVKHCTFFLLLVFFTSMACAQQVEYHVTKYDETTGLESNVINTMLQDSRGYLWFGTADGLCRYDGYNFKTFRKKAGETNSLPGNFIFKLAEDKDGKIWIGLLKDGISCYDPATGTFRNYDVKNVDPKVPLARAVKMIFIDRENNVWAGITQKGLIKLNRKTGEFSRYNIIADTSTFYPAEFKAAYNNVYDMYEESPGMFWLATHDGLYKFDSRSGLMTPERARPLSIGMAGAAGNELREDLFGCMLADKNGLWLGSWAGGLSFYNFKSRQWSNYKFSVRHSNISTTNIISGLKQKNENELWISSLDKGFGTFNKITGQFTFLGSTDPNDIPVAGGSGIMIDKQQNIWLSFADGLLKIKETRKKFIYVPVDVSRTENGSFYGINCILEDRAGKLLFTGTTFADGLHVTDKQTGQTKNIAFDVMKTEENAMESAALMEDSRNNIWLLTRDYIFQYDREKRTLVKPLQPSIYFNGTRSNFFMAMLEDKKGRIWFATARNGVFCYDPATRQYRHFFNDPADKNSLPSNVITALAIDGAGRIWVGGTRGCFGYLDNASGNFISPDQGGGLQGQHSEYRVYTLYTDRQGDIMAGTDAGLYYYDTHEAKPRLKEMYNSEKGLRGDLVHSIQEDANGDIWCTTSSALCKIERQSGNIITYKKQDGIEKISLLNGLYRFKNGQMAVFTVRGYYVFDLQSLLEKEAAVPAVITSFKIDDAEQYFENTIAAHKKMIVPASANVVSFEFAALDFERPDKQQYVYQLEGFDKDWVMAGQRRYAGYANLPGGDYTFRVKAITADNGNGALASIPFHIIQPLYKRIWFIALVCMLIAFSTYFIYRFKLRKQREIHLLESKAQLLEKEKTLVMYEGLKQQLNPHFLFNSLTALNSLIHYNQKLAGEFLEGLSRIYRYILKSRDNETVPLIEEIKFVQTFIRLQQTRFEKGLQVHIDIPADLDYYKIAPVTLQNLIENAIKHNIIDEESPLEINIYTEDEYVVVSNNLQKKNFVETSNKQGLGNLVSLYQYLSSKPIVITEDNNFFLIKIPLIV